MLPPDPPEGETELPALEAAQCFPLKVLEGGQVQSFPSGKRCAYAAFWWGPPDGSAWTIGHQSDEEVSFGTPRGRLTLPPRKLRPYLLPDESRVWTSAEQAQAPEVIREELAAGPVRLSELRLVAGQELWGRVSWETYLLPPRGGPPQERRNAVLLLSRERFDRRPAGELATPWRGFSY